MSSLRKLRLSPFLHAVVCAAGLVACGGGEQASASSNLPASAPSADPSPSPSPSPTPVIGSDPVLIPGAAVGSITTPLLFATQVPTFRDVGARASSFGNHLGDIGRVARGGDLMIRYPDGTLRNLTREAGFGMDEFQGAQAIAVRDPSVHWSGTKALFSMVIGAPSAQYKTSDYFWQLYEISGLGKSERVVITKVAGQPPFYNNISPIYGTDDRILFTSDRPRGGESHLYPQLDEYENMPTVTGIWSLDPATADLRLLNHAVSGAFTPTIDSYGRVIFTRWDHLQRDQQAEQPGVYGAFNFSDESRTAQRLNTSAEVFPEVRLGSTSVFGPVAGYTNNLFTPWQINEDGTDEETLNHIGRHELNFGLQIPRSFTSDPALSDDINTSLFANRKTIRFDGGLFHVKEDPTRPGSYLGIYAREFGSLTSDQIVRFNGGRGVNPEATAIADVTPSSDGGPLAGGRYRNPLPLSDGRLVASHTPTTTVNRENDFREFRLKQLTPDSAGRFHVPGPSLTGGISKSVSWWDPDARQNFSGLLWEMEPVEVVARTRPAKSVVPMEPLEQTIFAEEGVDQTALRSWLTSKNLALIVTRNQTSRDRADVAQPFNLQVPGGVRSVSPRGGKVYDIAHFQIFQADQIRGFSISPKEGRRPLAQAMHDPNAKNPANPGGPAGSVKIFADGSTAAFVPARRALAWQTTDAAGNAVVRERVWVTFQPGEVRVCGSCHGVNSRDQAGLPPPSNKPEALRDLLRFWKTLPK